jgi:hypothetical protein
MKGFVEALISIVKEMGWRGLLFIASLTVVNLVGWFLLDERVTMSLVGATSAAAGVYGYFAARRARKAANATSNAMYSAAALKDWAPRGRAIARAPGWRLNAFAKFVFPKKIYERVLQPTLADLESEYAEALAEGDVLKAKWVKVRGIYSFWAAALLQLPVSLVRLIVTIWKLAS